jgi:hypothetical protein
VVPQLKQQQVKQEQQQQPVKQEQQQQQQPKLPVAQYDFARREAYIWSNGARISSSSMYAAGPGAPKPGSSVNVQFDGVEHRVLNVWWDMVKTAAAAAPPPAGPPEKSAVFRRPKKLPRKVLASYRSLPTPRGKHVLFWRICCVLQPRWGEALPVQGPADEVWNSRSGRGCGRRPGDPGAMGLGARHNCWGTASQTERVAGV